jgi:hypothetical protein
LIIEEIARKAFEPWNNEYHESKDDPVIISMDHFHMKKEFVIVMLQFFGFGDTKKEFKETILH